MKTDMRKPWSFLAAITLLTAAATACADTIITGGAVSGEWYLTNSPYIIQGNISVAAGTQLTIDPGVVIRFQPGTSVYVRGTLTADGTFTNQILFTSGNFVKMPGDWAGISAESVNNVKPLPSVLLRNCQVEYATVGFTGVCDPGGTPASLFLIIESTTIRWCSGNGIWLNSVGSRSWTYTPAQISLSVASCNIYSNGLAGLSCHASQVVSSSYGDYYGGVTNNVVFRNGGNGIETEGNAYDSGLPIIENNTIWGNAANGISIIGWLNAPFCNNIIVSNAAGITASSLSGLPSFTFNDVWANGVNWAGDVTSYATGVGNISVNPLCVNPEAGDFHLRSQAGRYNPATVTWVRDSVTSPCIDAGDPASTWANEPQPNGGRVNLGADGNTPFASKSLPRVTGVMNMVTKDHVLSWDCAPGETYNLLYSSSLAGPWLDDLPGSQMTAAPSQTTLTFTNINGGTQSNRFYRVRWNIP